MVKIVALLMGLCVSASALATSVTVPTGYKEIWSDNFSGLSLTRPGSNIEHEGMWSAPNDDPRGSPGFGGYDWFVNPAYKWPDDYESPFAITAQGLRIRSQAPLRSFGEMLPLVGHPKAVPWLSGAINTSHGIQIKPPFYFEVRAKMPKGVGRPFPALWLVTDAHRAHVLKPLEYEIDVQEGFGDSTVLHSTIHWTAENGSYLAHDVVNASTGGVDLSDGFNTWGCDVSVNRQVFFLNGDEIGRVDTPLGAAIKQPFQIVLDVSAGMSWRNGGAPFGGPHDMTVRYVKLFAPDLDGVLWK